ncbi:hypothetical protein VitviT2T_009453 [Vitis vinifera]|uniref:Uncharacterized protein n=1 Tax=Vitis vinifera TaxID=29760 RepID=A0ABY9C5Q4_VITVI|nr:uncharacterized protein LOC100854629 isoform X2 [Vitis vinifera]WJZ90301.1 hypothetical protein VitviT2T_009453 [Vitis vinifera]|eukprot:XP_010652030.1 PREDICTED: uncharacterized protein LOC100854629 isoform X3 [Vitis vinifera]
MFPENPESDQSISEEEDWPQNCISLGGATEKKEGFQIQSQLELLIGTYEADHGRKTANLSHEKQTGFSFEDDDEMSVFHNGGHLILSPRKGSKCNSEERVYDDEKVDLHKFGSAKQDGDTWSAVTKETEELVHLNENAGCSSSHVSYSRGNKFSKGGKTKSKPKFSFRFQSNKEDSFGPFITNEKSSRSSKVDQVPEGLEAIEHKTMEGAIAEFVDGFHGEKLKETEIHAVQGDQTVGHGCSKHSVAELLNDLQEKNGLLGGKSKMCCRRKGRRVQLVIKKNISTSEDRTMQNEDPDEPMASGPSSDDEANMQNTRLNVSEAERKTMADRFHDALGAASVNDEAPLFVVPKPSGTGLFGKLQRVMQSEKERDMNFLKKLQIGASPNYEASCIDVKILSRFFEAKLTVCNCSLVENEESSQQGESYQILKECRRRLNTVIFSSRACGDVELEVANLIRIHPAWKEVQVTGSDKIIILATYFSQMSI